MVLQGSIKTNNTCLLACVVVGGVGSSPPSPTSSHHCILSINKKGSYMLPQRVTQISRIGQ